jgi:hypothetical protein
MRGVPGKQLVRLSATLGGRARIVVVFVCYLDDSGTTPDTPIIMIGGYVAPYLKWTQCEHAARLILKRQAVKVVSGKDLENGRKDFRGWRVSRKIKFVRALQSKLKPAALSGYAYGVDKERYANAKKRDRLNHQESAFGFSFRILVDQMLRDARIRHGFEKHGWKVSIVIEEGNKNNQDARRIYNQLRLRSDIGHMLCGFGTAAKDSTVSLQMADLLAFSTRRYAVACASAGKFLRKPPLLNEICSSGIGLANCIATGFEGGTMSRPNSSAAGFLRATSGDDFSDDLPG